MGLRTPPGGDFYVCICVSVTVKSVLAVSPWSRLIFTSTTRPVEQYCDECVCLCVCLSLCLSARISPEPHARSLTNFSCVLPMSMARSSSGIFTIGRIAYRLSPGKGFLSHWKCIIGRERGYSTSEVGLCYLLLPCLHRGVGHARSTFLCAATRHLYKILNVKIR